MNSNETIDLYLDLLKKSLTNTLFGEEPKVEQDSEDRFVFDFIEHYIEGGAISMLPMSRLNNLQWCISEVIQQNIPGDLIETGVWRGGTTVFMRAALKAHGIIDRLVWVADSFEGLPKPDAEKFPIEAKAHAGAVMSKAYNYFAASLEEVQRNFKAYGMLDDQVRFLKGWFKDTLPTAAIKKLAVIRLDGDYYESTMDGLTNLYDKLSMGGFVIIDDYGEDTWTYCRKAVDDFRKSRGITEKMVQVDSKCYFWQRNSKS